MKSDSLQLTSNQLKLIGLASMTLDHVGLFLLPQYQILRIIGRLAFPIFAYMIAEGCRYTANRLRYFLGILGLGLVCQLGWSYILRNLYLNILLTFSISIVLCFCFSQAREKGRWYWALFWSLLAAAGALCILLPTKLHGFAVDYGFAGVLLPLLVFSRQSRWEKLLACAVGLLLVCIQQGGIQWYCLAAIALLALYRGKRGTRKLKYLFYIYYPLHLAAIWAVWMLH